MSAPSLSNVFSDVYITGNCIIGGTVTSLANPVNSLMTILQDQKAQGTTGGTNGTGWQTRTLNTSVVDQIGVSLGSNQFTLPAGTYYVQISTPACQTNNHRCRLYNVTTSSTILLGTSECAQNSNPSNMSNRSFIDAYFTSAASGTYRVDQYFQTAYTSGGLGMPSLSGGTDVEIYTTVKIIKINSGAALSQWTTGGNNLYYTSGNVGIGLTNPVTILNVNLTSAYSNLYTTTSGGNASMFFVNTADSRRVFCGMDGTGLFAFSTGALALGTDNTPVIFAPNYGSGEKMRILTTGLVGIGTTNPGSLLTVSGGGSFGSGYQTFSAPTGGLIVQGNVGIGTSNPGVNALQVTGNVVTQGFTSNLTNTIFNFDTLTVPFLSATQINSGSTSAVQFSSNVDLGTGTMNAATVISSTGLMFRNRIINGDFRIDQRNAGASFTVSAGAGKTYTLDRWWGWCQVGSKFSVQRSTEVPVGQGFVNSVLVTSLSAFSAPVGGYYGFGQYIEGYNIADMGFGTASATTATLSFWARSSIAGTFSVALENGSYNRSYIFNYTINSTNTWQYFTLPFRADTTGTWDNTTGQGLRLWWDLGSNDTTYASTAGSWLAADVLRTTGSVALIATNAATLYIAGAQVEKGSAATPFEFRPFATELALCLRYYYQITALTNSGNPQSNINWGIAYVRSAGNASIYYSLPVPMRAQPTFFNNATLQFDWNGVANLGAFNSPVLNTTKSTTKDIEIDGTVTGGTQGQAGAIIFQGPSAGQYASFNAEL